VAGSSQSVKKWSAQESWNDRTLDHYKSKGILVGVLEVLAAHCRKSALNNAVFHIKQRVDADRLGSTLPLVDAKSGQN